MSMPIRFKLTFLSTRRQLPVLSQLLRVRLRPLLRPLLALQLWQPVCRAALLLP